MLRHIQCLGTVLVVALALTDSCRGQGLPESPLDRLDRTAIPADELDLVGAEQAPVELVAVIGSGKFSHWGNISDVVISPDGQFALTTGDDHCTRSWRLGSGAQIWRADDFHQSSHGIAFNSNGDRLATRRIRLRADRTMHSVIEVREFPSGNIIREIFPEDDPDAVAFSADGTRIAAAKDDRLEVWDTGSGERKNPANKRPARVPHFSFDDWHTTTRLAFSPDGVVVVGAVSRRHDDESKRNAIRVWDSKTGNQIRMIAGQVGRKPFLADGTLLAASFDGAAYLLNPREGTIVRQLVSPIPKAVQPFGWDGPGPPLMLPGGRTFALPSGTFFDKKVTVRLIDLATGGEQGHVEWPEPPSEPISALDVSADGKTFLIGGQPRLRFWGIETGREERSERDPVRAPTQIGFSRDESWLAIGGKGSQVAIWDFARMAVGQRLETDFKEVRSLAVSPDNRWLVAGGDQPEFVVWNTMTWEEAGRFWTNGSGLSHIHFLEQGRTLLTVSTLGEGQVWDATNWKTATGRPWKLTGKDMGLKDVTVTPDGSEVAAAVESKMVLNFEKNDAQYKGFRSLTLWRYPGGKARQLTVRKVPTQIAYSPDGKMLATTLLSGLFDPDAFNVFETNNLKPKETGVAIWSLSDANPSPRFVTDRTPQGLEFSPDGTRLAGVANDGSIDIWDVNTWKEIHTIRFGPAQGNSIKEGAFRYSPSGRHIAVCNSNGTVYILRLQSSRQ